MHDLRWSHAEKAVARQAYDEALEAARGRVLAEVKRRAAAAESADDVWAIEDYMTGARREIGSMFDYRYSQLILVFAQFIREGCIEEGRLAGLSAEKRAAIRGLLGFDPDRDRQTGAG